MNTTSALSRLKAAGVTARLLAGGHARVPGAIVLAYHDIGDDPLNTTDYYVSPAMLRAHLEAARRFGLQFGSLTELTGAYERGEPLDGLAAVVFDDALVGVHHRALPILAELGVPATVFAVTDALGRQPPWWAGADRVMTQHELVEVGDAGLDIASHTCTHPVLPGVDDADLRAEVRDAKGRLEDLVGATVNLFAYPFGEHDPRVRDAVADAGYQAAYTFVNGRITHDLDRYRLPRLNMSARQRPMRFAYHLSRSPQAWPDTQLESTTA